MAPNKNHTIVQNLANTGHILPWQQRMIHFQKFGRVDILVDRLNTFANGRIQRIEIGIMKSAQYVIV